MRLAIALLGGQALAGDFEFFEQKIRPVLVERCYKCHSAESEKIKGGLLLDTRDGLLKGGETGPALVPGDPEKSLLAQAIRYLDPNLQMPPKDKLKDDEIANVIAWIKMGAPDPRTGKSSAQPSAIKKAPYDYAEARKHWAFQRPQDSLPPKVKSIDWPESPVDHFILAKLEENNLVPARPADRRALIRRTSFDLIGLPPRPEEVDAFLADHSTNAFRKVVEGLLASPHYGERWGRHWLDVVRYADSRDIRFLEQNYDITEAWRYRDWVVSAFNRDLPYNQFIVEQIAGELLPPKEKSGVAADSVIATGMLAIGEWGIGDSNAQKMHTDIIDDQVNVVSRAFLSLTIGCARCHDHKFDPIPTADYYSLAGIFFSSHICIPSTTCAMVRLPIVPQAEVDKFNQYMAQIPAKEKQIQQYTNEQYSVLTKSQVGQTARYLLAAWDYQSRPVEQAWLAPDPFANERQLRPEALVQWIDYLGFRWAAGQLLTNVVREFGNSGGVHAWKGKAAEPLLLINTTDQPALVTTTNRPGTRPGTLPARSVAVSPAGTAGMSVGWKSPFTGLIRISGRVADAQTGSGDGVEWVVEAQHGDTSLVLTGSSIPDGGAEFLADTKGADRLDQVLVQTGDRIRLLVLPKKDSSSDLTTVEMEITERAGKKRHWSLTRDLIPGNLASDIVADLAVQGKGNPRKDGYGNLETWSFHDLGEPAPAIKQVERGPQSALDGWIEAMGNGSVGQGNRGEIERAAEEVQQAVQAVINKLTEPAPAAATGSTPAPAPTAPPPSSAATRLYQDLISEQGPFRFTKRDNEKLLPPEALVQVKKLTNELDALKKSAPPPLPVALTIKEGGSPGTKHAGIHDVAIHTRGRYDQLGEVVPRRFPRVLAGDNQTPISTNQGSGRLELARWIAQPGNPLTARVMVNRIWQHHFGDGLVRTPGNFGNQGERPTHPELLDYLACRFIEFGWSIKAMHRLIVLSSVYQQSSRAPAETLRVDADNRLLGRMNIRRLEAEAIRDNLLAVSLKLDRTMGGRPTRDSASLRRAIYQMTIRSDKSGYQFLFDAADPENVVDKRTVSTVAPQSLFLLNNPFPVSLLPALVERILGNGLGKEADGIERAYLALYGRPPKELETTLGIKFLAQARQKNADASDALRLAWLEYIPVLLNGNEFIYVN